MQCVISVIKNKSYFKLPRKNNYNENKLIREIYHISD